jgi:hypothetical protein
MASCICETAPARSDIKDIKLARTGLVGLSLLALFFLPSIPPQAQSESVASCTYMPYSVGLTAAMTSRLQSSLAGCIPHNFYVSFYHPEEQEEDKGL